MFDSYVLARQRQLPKWVVPVFVTAIILHALVLSGAVVHGYWAIEKLPLPKGGIELVVAPPPPPPPPAKKGNPANKPKTDVKKVTKVVKETVQPVKLDKPVEVAVETEGIGDPDGADDGDPNSTCTGPTCDNNAPPIEEPPPPPPKKDPPAPPQIVPQVALQAQMISGEKQIVPDDTTKTMIFRDGKNRLVSTFKICVNSGGNVSTIEMMKSTGYGAYDSKLKGGMRGWKFRPFMVNGKAVSICSAYTFIYNQKN
jgi:hypothetical protein